MQDYPICYRCQRRVDYDPVFEAICGHDECPSAVFHGLCLMEWRDHRDDRIRQFRKWMTEHVIVVYRRDDVVDPE